MTELEALLVLDRLKKKENRGYVIDAYTIAMDVIREKNNLDIPIQKAIIELRKIADNFGDHGKDYLLCKSIEMAIKSLSEPRLIRCRECVHYGSPCVCTLTHSQVDADDYCSYGEVLEK